MKLRPDEVGNHILQFCLYVTPCDQGDEAFSWITKDWGGGGTTCGFLCHAAMWLAGVRGFLCNRSDPVTKKGYTNGANISRIFNAGRYPFTFYKPGTPPPLPGSILFVSNGYPITEHVMIFSHAEESVWVTYDGGQKNKLGKECVRMRRRLMDPSGFLEGRRLQGFLRPQDLPLTEDPEDIVHHLSENWSARTLRDPATGEPL